ncbi:transposase, MuDR, MULE transposase domain protein [Tanacetum coccineum]|uniref:Transposase, MuDR, MULE transposase domain protein n=1 Tax=Tanacetum coccineum TaxID=301880 RepID=A0ABQ5BXB1_9ASTR
MDSEVRAEGGMLIISGVIEVVSLLSVGGEFTSTEAEIGGCAYVGDLCRRWGGEKRTLFVMEDDIDRSVFGGMSISRVEVGGVDIGLIGVGDLSSSSQRNWIFCDILNDEVYGKAISVGAVLILRNVSVFSPKSSGHYLNITLKNIVKVFHKDTSAVNSGSGASTSRESYWAVEI